MESKLIRLGGCFAQNLCNLFNQSLTQEVVPFDLKLARVTPLFKKIGSEDDTRITDPYHVYLT